MKKNRERGQALVIVVFMLVVLLVAAGLAIDGGTAFLERRRMQNAADSSSIAGTRELAGAICKGSPATAATWDQSIWNEVVSFAAGNGVEDAANNVHAEYLHVDAGSGDVVAYSPAVPVGGGTIPDGACGVSTLVTITRDTYLLSLIGIDVNAASGDAQAVTSPPYMLTGGGMRPFGVPIQMVGALTPGDPTNNSFSVSFDHNGGTITWLDGTVADQHQGWMNFGYMWNETEDDAWPRALDQSAGASVLKTWMENGWDGIIYGGDYIHAKPGVNASGVCKAPENTPFYVPVYDAIPDCPTEVADPKPACPTQGSSYVFHIVGFAGIQITSCDKKVIQAELLDMVIGEGVPNPTSGGGFNEANACETHSMAIALWD